MLSEKTSRKINILSFILFIGVMSIHTYNLDKYEINQNLNPVIAAVETFLNNFANRTCVYFFFMISGFLFFKKFDISLLGYKYKSRGISLVIPYLLWNIIYYLYYVITTRIPLIASLMSNNEKMKIGIASCIRYIWTGYYTLWFLRELIWLTICAPLWYVLLKRRKYYWSEWMLVFLILAGQGVANIPGIKLNIYYILGAYWGMNYKIIVSKWGGYASACFIQRMAILCYRDNAISSDIYNFGRNICWRIVVQLHIVPDDMDCNGIISL